MVSRLQLLTSTFLQEPICEHSPACNPISIPDSHPIPQGVKELHPLHTNRWAARPTAVGTAWTKHYLAGQSHEVDVYNWAVLFDVWLAKGDWSRRLLKPCCCSMTSPPHPARIIEISPWPKEKASILDNAGPVGWSSPPNQQAMGSKLHMSPRTNPGRPADVGAASSCSGSQSMLNAENAEYKYVCFPNWQHQMTWIELWTRLIDAYTLIALWSIQKPHRPMPTASNPNPHSALCLAQISASASKVAVLLYLGQPCHAMQW